MLYRRQTGKILSPGIYLIFQSLHFTFWKSGKGALVSIKNARERNVTENWERKWGTGGYLGTPKLWGRFGVYCTNISRYNTYYSFFPDESSENKTLVCTCTERACSPPPMLSRYNIILKRRDFEEN